MSNATNPKMIQAALNRVNSNFDEISSIANPDLQDAVRSLIQMDLGVTSVGTDGYNDEDAAGAEVYMTGGSKSSVAYGAPAFSADAMMNLGKALTSFNQKIPGFSAELTFSKEDSSFVLVLQSDAGE